MSEAADLLDAVETFVPRFVVLRDPQAAAVALWIAHSHAFEAADATPYLSITSAEMRSGKTRLLEVLELLVREPLPTANISDAALFRAISELGPTLLLDESTRSTGRRRGIVRTSVACSTPATGKVPSPAAWAALG